jgi:predicted amidohydrolase
MLIAAAQTPVTHDAAENGASIRAVMRAARLAGADLVHFPEGAASGYPTFPEQDWDLLQGELEQIAVLARELRLWTVFGSNRPISGEHRPRNSVYVVSDLGEIAGRYDTRKSFSSTNGSASIACCSPHIRRTRCSACWRKRTPP